MRHGFGGLHYPELQRDVKELYGQEFVSAGRLAFELSIDFVPIRLKASHVVIPLDEPGDRNGYWDYYVQFEPYHFEPDTYTLVGTWDAVNPNSVEAYIYGLPRSLEVELRVGP